MSTEIQRHYLLNKKLKHAYFVSIKFAENKLKFLSYTNWIRYKGLSEFLSMN
jgi:hypothetical protein